MKQSQNKIIKVISVIVCLSFVLAACSKNDTEKDQLTDFSGTQAVTDSTTAPPQPSTTQPDHSQGTTQEPTTVPVPPSTTVPGTTGPVVKPSPAPEHTTGPETTVPGTTQPVTPPQPEPEEPEKSDFQKAVEATGTIIGCYFMTPEQIQETAADLANDSKVYYVRLQDGTKTYYVAVDLQTAKALSLANPQVLRAVCQELEAIQQQQAGDDGYVLMDYTHLVGELEIHFVGYLLTGMLGGEDGPLASFYNSCKVADLNIDESRFGPIIDIIGAIYG